MKKLHIWISYADRKCYSKEASKKPINDLLAIGTVCKESEWEIEIFYSLLPGIAKWIKDNIGQVWLEMNDESFDLVPRQKEKKTHPRKDY